MSLGSLLTDTVTRRRAALTSTGYGNQVRDWGSATSVTYPARVGPYSETGASTSERGADEPRTTTRWKCTVGPDADLEATDRIEWDGDLYEVDGEVERHKSPRGLHHQTIVLLRISTGV